MNITLNTATLLPELRALAKVAAAKHTLPVLTHILISAPDTAGPVRLMATDIETGLMTTCAATITEPGAVAVNAATILALVEQLGDGPLTLIGDGNHVRATCGGFRSRLACMSAEEFPTLPPAPIADTSVPAHVLHALLRRVVYAMPAKDMPHVVMGVLLVVRGESAILVASDGRRLSVASAVIEAGQEPYEAVLPKSILDPIGTLTGRVELVVEENHLFFMANGRILYGRRPDSAFPPYDRIIPRNHPHTLQVDRVAWLSTLRRVRALAEDSSAVFVSVSGAWMTIATRSAQKGEADEAVALVAPDNPEIQIWLSGDSLIDFLEGAGGRVVSLHYNAGNMAVMLTDGEAFLNVLGVVRP